MRLREGAYKATETEAGTFESELGLLIMSLCTDAEIWFVITKDGDFSNKSFP